MTQQQITRIAVLLGMLWIAGQAIFQIAVATAPIPAFYWLNGANLAQAVAVMSAVALLLVTNTRRPKGIDPDLLSHLPIPSAYEAPAPQRPVIAYDAKGRPYGRRTDDVNPDHVGLVLAALRDLPPEARISMLGLGVVTDPAELRALRDIGDTDEEDEWVNRPAWADNVLKHKDELDKGESDGNVSPR